MAIPYKFLKEAAEWDASEKTKQQARLEELREKWMEQQKQAAQNQFQQYYNQMLNVPLDGLAGLGASGGLQQLGQTWGGVQPSSQPITYVTQAPVKPKQINRSRIATLKDVEARKALPRIPDRIEPIIGWRVWQVNDNKLCSVGVSGVWEPMKALHAECENYDHKAPQLNCQCGMWSFNSLETLLPAADAYDSENIILGSVYLWGKVIECENGFRAEFAYPKELWCMKPEHEELGLIYNVPVRV